MTISTPDIVKVIEARLEDCRCYGEPVPPQGFKPCGGCEHDNKCLEEIVRLRAERDEARRRTNSILTEIDCRIEHGAESNGHLEAIRSLFKEDTNE